MELEEMVNGQMDGKQSTAQHGTAQTCIPLIT